MAVAVGTLTIGTGAVGTTVTVSGLPFQPAWIILNWSGRASAGSGEADGNYGTGFATGTSSRRAFASQSDHTPTTMAADHMWRNDAIVCTLTIAGAVAGLADLDAITSDGFRLIVDDQFPAALIVGYICGTADSAAIVDFTDPAATGNQDYNAGIDMTAGATDDKFVLIAGGIDAAANTAAVYTFNQLGFAAGNTIAEAVLDGNSADGAPTSVTQGYCRSGRIIGIVWDDQVRLRASLTAWLSTGFRLNWAEVEAATYRFSALVVKGGNRYFVGDALTSTGTTNQTEATPYQPTALLLISGARAASADDASTAHDTRIVGAASGPSNRWCAAYQDKDNSPNADVWIDFRTDAIYSNPDVAAAQVVEGLMDIVSFDSTPGFTYVMDDADPSANFFAYLGFANLTSSQTIAVGLVTETDTTLAVGRAKNRSAGLNTETDAVLTLTRVKRTAIGLNSETDSPFSAGRQKTRALGQNAEVDESLALQTDQTIAVGLVEETDSILALTRRKATALGLNTEADAPFSLSWLKRLAIGLNTEADSALSARAVREYDIGQPEETDAAFGMARLKRMLLGLPEESNTAFAVLGGAVLVPAAALRRWAGRSLMYLGRRQ